MDGKRLEYKGEEALKELERLTSKVDEVQESILKDILKRNKETVYLKKFMVGSTNVSAFKCLVPVVTYSSIHPYIQRISNGEDSSLLSSHPITEFLCSSGTSGGEPKLMPSIAEDLDRRTFLYNLIMPIINQYVPGLDGGKAMYLYFAKAEQSTPSGLPARPVLTSYYKSKHFKCRSDPFNDFTSPDQTILCTDSRQSMYCQLLPGLLHRHRVLRLGAIFASAFLRAINFLERNWVQLCNDIRLGQLDPSITDPGCRLAILDVLTSPNPVLADQIEAICRRKSWKGVLCQLWPRAKYVEAVVTGSMAQYIPTLDFYSAGKLPLVCTMYASSECYLGVNLNPLCDPADVAYTILPNLGYFEFIPLGNNGSLFAYKDDEEVERDKLVNLAHVRIGCYYEIVVTTFAGLYRYRIGDVLQVTGFHNKAPQFRFVCRRNVVLSIDNDKTSEEDLHKSVTMAKKLLEPYEALLVEYTSCTATSTIPGHYIMFWEIVTHTSSLNELTQLETHLFEDCCMAIEESLDYVYRRCRTFDRSVGPLEIRVVEPGTFELLMDLCINQGGSINQYKTPRCINSNTSALDLLNSRVCASFFSPRDPTWIP
ncbi:putative indole-3-acetic acid-amido synthetase GH3.9 [Macadamia integrifolia]|uniref:putative indole-3-acetic acid-amido synthetase GH3.9 n=1 Tax=Macadamia integrifolia TaxID=60698 RepID=UPI001C53343B|nr:putative indole-3-acetic acid-amido synthetase GH3.9 [Macadamia integrifolia]